MNTLDVIIYCLWGLIIAFSVTIVIILLKYAVQWKPEELEDKENERIN